MSSTAATASPGLAGNRNWRLLFVGQSVSLIGDAVFDLTLVLWVGTVVAARYAWAPAAVSGVLVAASVPILVVGPVAGVFVDRWDRRRIMMASDLVRAVLVCGLVAVSLEAEHLPVAVQLSSVYAVVALASTASQFFNPSRFAMIERVVSEQDRARAFGLSQASVSTAAVVGPPLAAPLLFGAGVEWSLIINAASFLVSFISVRLIRLEQPGEAGETAPKRRFWFDFTEGLKFFGGNRLLVILTITLCVYTLGVGSLNVLDVFFVKDNLHVSADWLGFISGGFGVGSIVGALIVGPLAPRFGEIRTFCYGLSLTGLLILAYARMTNLPVAVAVLALAGVPVGAVSAVASPLILRATPSRLIGRVTATLNPLMQLSGIVSMAVAGFLASTALLHLHVVVAGVHMSRIDVIFSVAGLLMVVSGITAIRPMTETTAADALPSPSVRVGSGD